MFPVYTTQWEFKNVTITDLLDLHLGNKKQGQEYEMIIVTSSFLKSSVHTIFKFLLFEERFRNALGFWDRLVWKVGLKKQTSVLNFLQQGLIHVGSLTRYINFDFSFDTRTYQSWIQWCHDKG